MTSHFTRFCLLAPLALIAPASHAADEANPIGRFEVSRYEVSGNTLLPQTEVEWLLKPFTGKSRDFGDVQRALEALEAFYRARGFNVVQVTLPEQELNQGVVHLKVVETRLGKVTVEGNRHVSEENVRNSLPGLNVGQSPNIAAVSRSLKVANENPARKIVLQLQSSERDEEIDALLKVSDEKPWTVGIGVDNTGDTNTGRNRVTAQFQHANVGGRDHVASLQYTTSASNPSQVAVYGAGYHVPLYALGDSLDFYGSYSDVDSGTVSAGLFDLLVSGKGTVFGARYNHHFDRRGEFDSRLSAGFDYKAFRNNVSLQGIALGNDVTVRPLSIAYGGAWTPGQFNVDFSISAARNIAGGANGSDADFNRVRAGASANYSLLRYSAGFSRLLPNDWLLRLAFSGQHSGDALVPGEQFGAGGNATVRGFHEREVAGDSGRVANLEIQTPNLCGSSVQCRLLGFYDHGYTRRNNVQAGEQAHASIASAGVGLRMNVDRHIALQADLGRVVDAADTLAKGEQRLHFRMNISY